MRLHCSWTVLVAIVWTILLHDSATDPIKNEPTGRTVENPRIKPEKSVSTYNERNENRRDNDSYERSERPPPLPEYTLKNINTLTSISQNSTDESNASLETTDSDHYVNHEFIPLKENTVISHRTNEGANCSETSEVSKARKTVDVKMDDHIASENRSPHDRTVYGKLPAVVRKSDAGVHQSKGDFQDSMSSTTIYSSNKLELMGFSSSTIDDFTSTSITVRKGLSSSTSDGDSKVSSKDTRSGVVFFAGMKIGPENHGKEEKSEGSKDDVKKIAKTVQNAAIDRAKERSIRDNTIITMRKPNLLDKMLDTNKLDERHAANTNNDGTVSSPKKKPYYRELDYPGTTNYFVETTNLQRKKTNRATISSPSKNDGKIALSPSPHRPTDFHIGVVVSSEIAPGSFEKQMGKNSEPPATHSLYVDTSFSMNDVADGLRRSLTGISSQSNPYPTIFSEKSKNNQRDDTHKKLQNLQGFNYPGPVNNKRELYFASAMTSGSSEINDEKATITGGNKAEENEISRSGRFGGTMNNVDRPKPTSMLGETGEFRRWQRLDKTSNQDGEKKYRVYRNVVKNTLTGSQMTNIDHKMLISRAAAREISFLQQLRQEVQEPKKPERKLILEIDSLEKDEFHTLKNGPTALENSKGFSLAVEMQHENVLNSISSVTPKRTRKMELSGSELDDARASWKIKAAPKQLFIISRVTDTVKPLGSPQFQRTNDEGMKSNVPAVNVIKEYPVNSIGKIDNRVTSDSLLSIDSSFPEVYRKDFEPDTDGSNKEYDCSDESETTKGFRAKCRQQRTKAFSYRVLSASDSRKESGHAFRERRTTVDVDSVGVTPDGQRKRKRWKDKIVDATIATDTKAFNPFVSILLKGGNHEITDVTRTDCSDKKNVEEDRNDKTKEKFSRQSNYIRKVKIDETSGMSMVNRLKLRDSTVVNDDAPEIRRETRNDIAGEASAVKSCETCKIVTIVENMTTGPNKYNTRGDNRVVGGGSDVDDEQSWKKIEPSMKVDENSKDTVHPRITKKNEMPVVSVSRTNDVDSLARSSTKLKLIDPLEPEERIRRRRMHEENSEMLVPGQEPIFIEPKAENLILSRERVAHQSLSAGKLSVPDSAVPSGLMLHLLNEKAKNSSSLERHAGSPESFFPMKSETHEELKHGPLISSLTESFARTRISSPEFPNNAAGIPRDYGNFNTYSTLQPRSLSGGGRRRKSVGHEQRDESWASSTKTDSTTSIPIDRPPYNDGYPMREELLPHSHSTVSATRHQDGKLPNNAFVEQIKSGFTSAESTSIPVTVPTLTSSYGHTSSITVTMPEDRDIKSTETIIRTTDDVVTGLELSRTYPAITEIEQSLKSIETPPREFTNIPVVELSSENPVILGTNNSNPVFTESFMHDKSLMMRGRESANLQPTQRKQTTENTVIATGNIQTFNYTVNDNSTRTTATLNQWPVKYSAVVEGDLVLGGLMMVHEREDSVTCGPVMPQGGVQALEAMLYTLDWVNKRDLVPGVKIGAHILDDCDKDTYGLEMAVDFIKGSISNIDGAEYHCNKTAVRKVISGVVGAASSVTSIQVANLLRLFRIPQVSFFSTSPELSNKMRFEYFTRTIPSDHYQVKAMVDIVLVMGWSYVSIIYEESNYGEKAYEELEKLLGKHQICIAVKEKLSKDSGVAKAHVYDNIVLKLLTKPRARGCIIFASDQEVAGVMKAVRRCNATGAFSWIGSDGWSARSLVSDGNEPEMEGTLSVQPQANPVEGFEDYFLNLTVENNRRNPWFVEFWEDHFKCRYPNASQTPYNNYTEECTTTERLTKQNTAFENQLQFVSDAVMAFAYAFRNMHADLCHGIRGLCDAMKPTKGTELLSYLRTVQFKGLSGDVFHFDKNGDGPARYNIIHFKQVSPGKYKWIRVGKYLEGELRLNMSEIQFRLGHPQPPESVCSLPCEVGQAKKYVEGESCCWHCFNCTQYQIRHESDEKQCVLCPQGTVPDETHSYCRDIPENFLRPESGWAIGAMSFSSIGILITLFVGGVFLKHNDTPIVRASGRELSYVLLTGILLCYLVTFALVLRPNDLVCSIQRFTAGFCFTVVYAALLTKTNRISRIFNAGKHSAKRPSFISPRSQLIICGMLVAVQILINGVWMVIDPARAMHHYPTREDNLLVCNSYIDASYMIAFTYPIILIVVCTVYAVLTRKIPEAFNESKHIGFTMYTTCVIWLAFVPLYFGTGSQVALRITSMSVTISLSASVTIACLFFPKLYIILIHPERNVRPNMMMTRYNTTKGSVVTATNASSMMAPVTLTAVTCDQNKAVKKHVITTTDCSTQSEQFEMEAKDQKNGKLTTPAALVTRSTQTLLNNNGKESGPVTSPAIKDIIIEENLSSAKGLNIGKIGNGPLSQNDIPL